MADTTPVNPSRMDEDAPATTPPFSPTPEAPVPPESPESPKPAEPVTPDETPYPDRPEVDRKADGPLTVGTGEGQLSPAARPQELADADIQVDTSDADRIASGDKVPLYNIHAGITRRVGGPFLDQLELEQAEVRRAVVEDRAPDFENMAGSAGVPMVTAGVLAQAHAADSRALGTFIEDNSDNSGKGPTPMAYVDAAGNATAEVLETQAAERQAYADYDESKVTSHDDPEVVFTPLPASVSKGE